MCVLCKLFKKAAQTHNLHKSLRVNNALSQADCRGCLKVVTQENRPNIKNSGQRMAIKSNRDRTSELAARPATHSENDEVLRGSGREG